MILSEAIYMCSKKDFGRYHKKRVIVAKALQDLDCCATADEIWTRIYTCESKVSAAAVYKILDWLIKNDFAEKRERLGGQIRYALKN